MPSLFVEVGLRCELTPAEGVEGLQNNEMFSDLNMYLKLKEQDHSLQCNSTKIKITSFLLHVKDGV